MVSETKVSYRSSFTRRLWYHRLATCCVTYKYVCNAHLRSPHRQLYFVCATAHNFGIFQLFLSKNENIYVVASTLGTIVVSLEKDVRFVRDNCTEP